MSKSNIKEKNVFPIGKSYLHFNLQCLSALGIWNPYGSGIKYWLYQLYWAYVMYVITAMRYTTTLVRGINAESSVEFVQEFATLAVEMANFITYMAFLFHRVDVLELCEAFNWERHLLGTDEITKYRNKELTSALSYSKVFTILLIIAPIQYFIFLFYNVFNEADYQVERLIIGGAPMKYWFILTNFWVAFITDFVSFTFLGVIAGAHYAFIMAVMINVKAQLKIFNYRLERCHMTTCEIDDGRDDENLHIIFFESVERQFNNKYVSLDPNVELINCIKYHQHIVRILSIFKKIYNKAFLPQLFISLLLITALLLELILGKDGNNADAVIAMGFLVPAILQLLTFCLGGNIILVRSDLSSNSLYTTHWYDRDREFRQNMKIFLGAIRHPLIVSAGGLCELSAVTFKNILCKAYSAVAVLKNMDE